MPQRLYPDGLAFEIGNAANGFLPEQIEAADMHACQDRDCLAAIDGRDKRRRVIHGEIDFAAPDRPRPRTCRYFHVADIGKALGAQQLLGDPLGTNADARAFRKLHGSRFEDPFGGHRRRNADEARRACQ
jgi:hypothetical protein